MDKKRYQVIVSGIVQGVGFRYATLKKANELGITGWIKNRIDGKVETVIEGENDSLKQMLSWLKKGPSQANITDTEVQELIYKDEYDSFKLM